MLQGKIYGLVPGLLEASSDNIMGAAAAAAAAASGKCVGHNKHEDDSSALLPLSQLLMSVGNGCYKKSITEI